MVDASTERSICRTCNHQSECLSLRNSLKSGTSVIHCEEFESSGIETARHSGKERPSASIPPTENACPVRPMEEKGLCSNCANNHGCAYPCFGSNVIYCEEYRLSFSPVKADRPLIQTPALFSPPYAQHIVAGSRCVLR